MDSLSSSIVRSVGAVLLCFLACGGILWTANAWLSPRITAYQEKAAEAAQSTGRILDSLKEEFPQANECEVLGTWAKHDSMGDYYAIRSSGSLQGYAIESWGKGYQSTIAVLIALDADLTVKAVRILDQQETEGLGTRIMEAEFLSQFSGKHLEQLAVTTEGEADRISAIAAATISTRAVTEDAVAGAVAFLKQRLSN